jgi:mRNA interferase MazF
MVSRAEVHWVDLGVPVGSSPGYTRPGIIISANRFNHSAINTITVVLIYSNVDLARHPGNVLLSAQQLGLSKDSVANVTQLASVDRSQLSGQIGIVPPSLMRDIDSGLRLALAL